MSGKFLLHSIILPRDAKETETPELIYRGAEPEWNDEKFGYEIKESCDFSTYFNSFSLTKWMRHTIADSFFLELKMKGSFSIELFGFNVNEKKILKKLIFSKSFDLKRKGNVKIEIPKNDFNIVSFTIVPKEDTFFFGGAYYCEADPEFIKSPKIGIITTTYKKEDYIRKNAEGLKKLIFTNERLAPYFDWLIVDNGGSKELEELADKKIRVVHNPNTGGSGGVARGMIESNARTDKPTHIILTDDDIEFIPGSFERVYALLSLIKDEYKDNFIAGAMLREDKPWLQIEDVGHMASNGFLGGIKDPKDLRFLSRVVSNEEYVPYLPTQYSAWWFCCIPMSVATPDNLPMPFFVRDDDVDYSVRKNVGVITLNGIGVRHERFYERFSGVNEYYLGLRNELILKSLHDEFNDYDIFYLAKDVLKRELYKYNYKAARMVMRAIEDYLKGPGFLENVNPAKLLPEIKAMDNEYLPLTDEIKNLTGYKKLKKRYDLNRVRKFIYDYTYNGQKFISFIPAKGKGVIEKGWKYCVEKQFMAKEVYSVDKKPQTYAVYKKDLAQFKEIMKDFAALERRFHAENEAVVEAYRKAAGYLHSEKFWKSYFKRLEEET